jgi:PAS domain S-box-containing protein
MAGRARVYGWVLGAAALVSLSTFGRPREPERPHTLIAPYQSARNYPQNALYETDPLRLPRIVRRQLRRWSIDPTGPAPASDSRFQEPTVWDRYRWYIVGVIALSVLQAVMIALLVVERSRRRRSQKRYALATAAGGVGVWDWNLETNQIYVDPSVKAILGYQDDEIRNHVDDWDRTLHPDDAPIVMERIRDHVRGDTPFYEVEHRRFHRDGTVRWFLRRGSAEWRDGRPVRIIGTDTDITERKKSEQTLEEAQQNLARVARLTALGEFAASVAHEVRQPLTSIVLNAKACLRFLASAQPDLTEIRSALWDVVDAGKRASELIERDRELFRQHTISKEQLDINEVVLDVAVLAGARLNQSEVMLNTRLGSDLPPIDGDRIELQQVLLNLLVNAIDATECVATGLRSIQIATGAAPDGAVKCSVTDNGVGLGGVDMQRLFSLSYTTKENGSGIGLSLSRSIVEAHGGRLWAEQNPDCGATFSFTVPVHSVSVTA